VKHLEDLPGDRVAGRVTWPGRAGSAPVRRAARVALLASLFLLPLPSTAGGVGERYLYLAAPLAGVPLALSFWWLRREGARYGLVSAAIKGALFGGLIALAIAG
jgi:4-hydroxybenzoate polyprenyltransferase